MEAWEKICVGFTTFVKCVLKKDLQLFQIPTYFLTMCCPARSALTTSHCAHAWFMYVLFALLLLQRCKSGSFRNWFSALRGKKKTAHVSLSQPPCLYTALQYIKQDRSIGTEKRAVPTIAMLLQHHRPLGFAGCQAAVTHRAVCLFSLPFSWPYGA